MTLPTTPPPTAAPAEQGAPPVPLSVVPYEPSLQPSWDAFVRAARNPHFMHLRPYMDYHADRFVDASLLVYEGGKLAALLPASREGRLVTSHAGLTFGGLIVTAKTRMIDVLAIFDALKAHLASTGAEKLLYKAMPHIYHRAAGEEDLYALFRHGATLVRREIASALYLHHPAPPLGRGRRSRLAQAKEAGVVVHRSESVGPFIELADAGVRAKYGKALTHNVAEMTLLASRFPDNIKLYVAELDGELLGGMLMYENAPTAHVQYLAATDRGKAIGGRELIFEHLLAHYAGGFSCFDFGICTEQGGHYLNEGLIDFKESHGARGVCYDSYQLTLG